MSGSVYLDYAATSALRPPEVLEAVAAYLRDVGATPGRAGHQRALTAGRLALRCRQALATLFGASGDPGRVVFQLNATHALNVALQGFLRPGDRVVRTRYDHNSVRRTLGALQGRGVEVDVLSGRPDGGVDLAEAEELLLGPGRKPPRMLAIPHASNVLGSVLPVRALADLAHAAGAAVLVDGAQTAGHLQVDVEALGVDLFAFSGHKGLLGPQGTGGLWVREGIALEPLLFGGTGGDSDALEMPESLPDRLEVGTVNAPGIAGLLAGVEWIAARGAERLHRAEQLHKAELLRRLRSIPGVRVHSPPAPDGVGIVTLTCEGFTPSELAMRLDREHGVQTRSGLHCAPEAHEVIGTLETGAVRFSTGWATTEEDIERAATAMERLSERREDGEDGRR